MSTVFEQSEASPNLLQSGDMSVAHGTVPAGVADAWTAISRNDVSGVAALLHSALGTDAAAPGAGDAADVQQQAQQQQQQPQVKVKQKPSFRQRLEKIAQEHEQLQTQCDGLAADNDRLRGLVTSLEEERDSRQRIADERQRTLEDELQEKLREVVALEEKHEQMRRRFDDEKNSVEEERQKAQSAAVSLDEMTKTVLLLEERLQAANQAATKAAQLPEREVESRSSKPPEKVSGDALPAEREQGDGRDSKRPKSRSSSYSSSESRAAKNRNRSKRPRGGGSRSRSRRSCSRSKSGSRRRDARGRGNQQRPDEARRARREGGNDPGTRRSQAGQPQPQAHPQRPPIPPMQPQPGPHGLPAYPPPTWGFSAPPVGWVGPGMGAPVMGMGAPGMPPVMGAMPGYGPMHKPAG